MVIIWLKFHLSPLLQQIQHGLTFW